MKFKMIKAEEEYKPTNSNRLYEFDSDESLNIFDHEAFSVPTFQPMPNFGRYNANEYLQNSPHLNYRRHSSYSHEDILNMKYQHVPVDPRYRDSRPFVKSSSSIYDNVRRDFMSRRRSSSSLQDDVLRPFQLLQMNEYMRKSSPTMNNRTRSTSPNMSDKSNTNSNWNLNPSIFIEEYDDTKSEVKSNNSLTNISNIDIHQPLNVESVAPFAGCDEIPFIDDENVLISAHHTCDDNIPDVNCVTCNEPTVIISKPPPMPQYMKNRKTVSFDLEMDTVETELSKILPPPQMQQQTQQSAIYATTKKPNTCDHIMNIMLNKCGKDAGTKSHCAPIIAIDTTSDDLTHTTNEPIFKFCTYKRSNSNTKPNNGTESFKNIPSLDNDNLSAYFCDEESNNGQILTNNKNINSTSNMIDAKAIMLDLSELNSITTSSSTTQHDSGTESTVTEIIQQNQNTTNLQTNSMKNINVLMQRNILSQFEAKCLPGTGNVKALRNYFEQMKMPRDRHSKSSPNLSNVNNRKLSASERQSVMDQLKMWSEYGTAGMPNVGPKKSNIEMTDRVTRSVLDLTVTATFDEHEHTSKIKLFESNRSTSEPNIEICTDQTAATNKHKKFPESYIIRKQKITTNIETMENCAQSCPNLQCLQSQGKRSDTSFNSKLKASIYNSPCHRSTYLTLRKIKQNKKVNKLVKNSMSGSGTSGSSNLCNILNDSDGGDETR